ncbi:hypothetical protein GCM10020220_111560 [Nonomuraea rubra]|uniref:hypothetical protein n=1 Tax=Nonomuraea rubra TaxID=46180 RepID=UPI0031E66C3B
MPLLPWSAPLAIGASLILVLLLLIAVLNGLRLAWRPCADAALPAWAWWAATSGAALTVSYVCYASARDRSWAAWLDYDTASIAGVAWDQLWLPLQRGVAGERQWAAVALAACPRARVPARAGGGAGGDRLAVVALSRGRAADGDRAVRAAPP